MRNKEYYVKNEYVGKEEYERYMAGLCFYSWLEEIKKEFAPSTVELPDHIDEVEESICEKVLSCIACGRNYKIIPQEFTRYKNLLKVALPRKCFFCRHKDRMALRNPRKLWKRTCAKCGIEIQTSYAPDRPEIVYCEACYLEAVY